MTDVAAKWSLATVEVAGTPVACIELAGDLYRLEPSLARAGLAGKATLMSLFDDWPKASAALDAATEKLDAADRITPTRRLAPLLYPGKILCAGANYFDHLAEMGMPGAKKADQRLFFFMKPPRNAVVGEGATVRMPIGTKAFDWEIELAAVIGKSARNVSVESRAFACRGIHGLDRLSQHAITIAHRRRSTSSIGSPAKPTTPAAHSDRVSFRHLLSRTSRMSDLKLAVNGETKQNGRTTDMIFSIAEQISIASKIMTLDPGDVLLTGTPAGVGVPKQTFLKVGDKVDASIESIGTLAVIHPWTRR